MKEIILGEFCDKVSINSEVDVVSEQVIEAIGGISNLYLEYLINNDQKQITFKTQKCFATKELKISNKAIIKEISNCTGASEKRSKIILKDITDILMEYVSCYELNNLFVFKPLGAFKVLDAKRRSFLVTYNDPAALNYKDFLLGWE